MTYGIPGKSIPDHAIPDWAIPGYGPAPAESETVPDLTGANDFDAIVAGTVDDLFAIYGEYVWYKPVGGDGRKVTVIVDRQSGAAMDDAPRTRRHEVRILAKPSATEGIDPDAWTDRDTVVVADGPTATGTRRRRLIEIVARDAGLIAWRAA